jgi:hypothetical protein
MTAPARLGLNLPSLAREEKFGAERGVSGIFGLIPRVVFIVRIRDDRT